MNTRRLHRAILLALAATWGLAACGGGGGGGLVRSPAPSAPPPAPPPPPPPPPPPARSLQLPAPPVAKAVPTAPAHDDPTSPEFIKRIEDARRRIGEGFVYDAATGIYRVSTPANQYFGLYASTPGSLTKQGEGGLSVSGRFDGGIRVERGVLVASGTVHANLSIAPGAAVSTYWADIVGNVENHGTLYMEDWSDYYDSYTDPDIFGDYSQFAGATLSVSLASQTETVVLPKLTVSGRANLDGTLQFRNSGYVPSSSYLEWVLHARGGVFGQFAHWTSPGLLINGTLLYDSNNVWLELTRVSVQAAMTTAGAGSTVTLASAGNLDRALSGADVFATAATASLNAAQSRFLQSAGHLLWLSDPQQAQRSLDSLAGSVHVDALHRATQGDAMSTAMSQRLLTLQPGRVAGSWSRLGAEGTVAGFDQWLSPRLLLGASTSLGSTAFGGQARDQASQAALYLRWFGDNGWYAGGSAGFARHALTVDRPIDLGPGGRWNAHSQRGVGVAAIDAEVGQRFSVGGGILAPYAALGADVIRSERAREQGATGFELALQANTQARFGAGVGLRYGKRWHIGEGSWLQLDADARVQHGLADAGSPLQAAFIGVPDVGFVLPGRQANTSGWLDVGLRGGFGPGWNWSLGHTGSFAGPSLERRWLLGLQRSF